LIFQDHLRENLMRYLTGKSTEEESSRFEERLLADQEFSDAAAACEQELIDAYASNSLDAKERDALQLWIEASPRRMQRVTMSRALFAKQPQRIRQDWRIAGMLAAAACIVAAVGVTLFLANRPIRSSSTAAMSTPPAHAVAPSNGLTAKSAGTTEPQIIFLVAERIRGEQQITSHAILQDAPVEMQVLLPQEIALSGYTLTVSSLDDGSHILLKQEHLQARSAQGRLYLSVKFAAGSLPRGRYRASVSRGEDKLTAQFTIKQ
jgi:anti-sigma-K factor RskA